MWVEHKGDGSPVTGADVAADRSIRRFITEHFAGDAVASEELGGQLGDGPNRPRIIANGGGTPTAGALIPVQVEGDSLDLGAAQINPDAKGHGAG